MSAASFGAHSVVGGVTRRVKQPAHEYRSGPKSLGALQQQEKDGLRDVVRHGRIVRLPYGGVVNHREMSLRDGGKRVAPPAEGEIIQQLGIGSLRRHGCGRRK